MRKIRLLTVSVFRRISSYTVADIYDRNTITCFMAKYGRIRSVYGMYTVVYETVYDRLRPYTVSVTVDLGGAKVHVNVVQEMGFFFMHMILPPITYTFQCFASTQYDDKENLFVTCSRVLEAAVGIIVTFDGARINELPYQLLNFKLGKCLCRAIGISTFVASIIPRTMDTTVVTVKNRHVYCRLPQFTGCKLPIW